MLAGSLLLEPFQAADIPANHDVVGGAVATPIRVRDADLVRALVVRELSLTADERHDLDHDLPKPRTRHDLDRVGRGAVELRGLEHLVDHGDRALSLGRHELLELALLGAALLSVENADGLEPGLEQCVLDRVGRAVIDHEQVQDVLRVHARVDDHVRSGHGQQIQNVGHPRAGRDTVGTVVDGHDLVFGRVPDLEILVLVALVREEHGPHPVRHAVLEQGDLVTDQLLDVLGPAADHGVVAVGGRAGQDDLGGSSVVDLRENQVHVGDGQGDRLTSVEALHALVVIRVEADLDPHAVLLAGLVENAHHLGAAPEGPADVVGRGEGALEHSVRGHLAAAGNRRRAGVGGGKRHTTEEERHHGDQERLESIHVSNLQGFQLKE